MREPRHRHRFVPRGESQPKNSRSFLSIFIEEFIKITHAKQQHHARMAIFGLQVLLHHWGGHLNFWESGEID